MGKSKSERTFMPAVEIEGLRVPAQEFANEIGLQAFLAGKLPADMEFLITTPADDSTTIVGLPMPPETFLKVGIFFSEWIHSLCEGTTAAGGNEFLCCYGRPEDEPPAIAISASLMISDDNCRTWCRATRVSHHPKVLDMN